MSTDRRHVEPREVLAVVESYVARELNDAEKYDNRKPLDESGVFALHMLAAEVYALGFADGENVQGQRETNRRMRAARGSEAR